MAGKTALKQVENEVEVTGGVEELVLAGQIVDDLDEMFNDLEAGLTGTVVVAGLPEVNHGPEEHQIAAGRAVQNEELRTMALEEMEETASPLSDESKMPVAQGAKKAPTTKRISTMGMKKSEALATALGDNLEQYLTIDTNDEALDDEAQFDKRLALLDSIDALPIKIGEKATNLFAHVAKGAVLSVYTRKAIAHMVEAGEMTSKSLKDLYCTRYSEGTASSQTTQMMKLLPILGIALRESGKLVPNPTSTLLPLILAAAAQPEPESEAA